MVFGCAGWMLVVGIQFVSKSVEQEKDKTMIEYLTTDAAKQQLEWGKTIEVLLYYGKENGLNVIRYATLASNRDGDRIVMSVWECEDVGNLDYIDIYSFPFVEPDNEVLKFDFEYIDELFDKVTELGGKLDKFTRQFGLQHVYEDILKTVPK